MVIPRWLYFYKIPRAEPELDNRIYMDWQPQYSKRKKKFLNLSPQEPFRKPQDEFFTLLLEKWDLIVVLKIFLKPEDNL